MEDRGLAWARAVARPRVLLALTVAALGLSALSYGTLDRTAVLFFRAHAKEVPYTWIGAVTDAGDSLGYLVIAGFLYIGLRLREGVGGPLAATWRRLKNAALYVFLAIAVTGIAVNVIKPLVGRPRPRYFFRDGEYGFQPFNFDFGMNGMPSGHTQTIVALAAALVFLYPRILAPAALVAVVVGVSRVAVGAHFPSDVLMGAWLGLIGAALLRAHVFSDLDPQHAAGRGETRLSSNGKPA